VDMSAMENTNGAKRLRKVAKMWYRADGAAANAGCPLIAGYPAGLLRARGVSAGAISSGKAQGGPLVVAWANAWGDLLAPGEDLAAARALHPDRAAVPCPALPSSTETPPARVTLPLSGGSRGAIATPGCADRVARSPRAAGRHSRPAHRHRPTDPRRDAGPRATPCAQGNARHLPPPTRSANAVAVASPRPVSWLEMHPSASRGALIPMMQATQDRHRAYRARAVRGLRR